MRQVWVLLLLGLLHLLVMRWNSRFADNYYLWQNNSLQHENRQLGSLSRLFHVFTISCYWDGLLSSSVKQSYVMRKNKLSILDSCILWASRIIIPPAGQQLLLDELHDTHLGVSKMKALAQSYICWPGMNSDIENLVMSCSVCQESWPVPAAAPLHSWEWPSQPWSRIHLDFADPFLGHMFLLLAGWRTFKMVGCPHHAVHYRCQDHWEVMNHVC